MNPDPYKGLGTIVDPNEEQGTTVNPYEGLGTTVDPYEGLGTTVDPYEGLGTLATNSNYFVDKTKRLGKSLAQVPGQFVESVGQMADATGRALAVVGADELNALRDSPTDKRLAAFNQALRTPTPGTALIRDTGREMTQSARDLYKGNYAPDPARDAELGSDVAGSTGSLVAALVTPGNLVAKTITGAMLNSQGQSDEAREIMLRRGATEQDADDEGLRQFVLNLPAGALEAVPWEAALKRFGGTKIADAVAQKYGKTALRRISTAVFGQAATNASEEVLQKLWGDAAAKLTYDPTRAVTEGIGKAALVGGVMGAGFGGTAQTTAEIASALDTRQNLAESKKTLLAQQQKLVRGLHSAQMFPVDAEGKVTNELPLPPEMARVVTKRGVFHYNPALIDEATLLKLSGVGRENGPLGLGSQSKADVAARVAQGDPAVTVTERQTDGTEVKASVATLDTAGQTAAELAASKTPGNTVQVEPLGQVVAERSAVAAPNFIEGMLAADAAAATAAREAAAKEEVARTERQTELAEKKARFEERLAVARQTLADPAASFPAVDGALTSLTSYAEDRSIGLTQTQREQALATQAALQKRHALLAPDAAAAADAAAATRRTEAKLAEDVKTEKVRRERAALQHLETTGRDLATGEITDLTYVPDEELAALDANAEGLTPAQIDAEQQRRGEQAERAAATANEAGYTLRDLIFGKKAALAAAGQRSALRLKSPAALSLEGGTMAGEHRALGERQGGFKIFSDTGLAEDALQERLQSLGFDAPDVTTAYALYEQALAGEEIRPERGSEQQIDFAARTATPSPILTDTQVAEQLAALRRAFPVLTRDLDLRSGLVAEELERAGYGGPVPAGVQAAILRLQAEKRLLVIATSAMREGKGAARFLHEMAHPFFDALPAETKTILRQLHAQEMETKTGPLFNAKGQLTTDLYVLAEDFAPARLRADPDLPVKEWFAERIRALNADWLAGRLPRDHSTMLRVWRELLAKLRAIFAQVRGLDPDSDLFTTTFRRWLDMGAKTDLTAAGLAYATRQQAEFASRQDTANAALADSAPRTDFRDAEEQRAYLANPDNFNNRPYPGVVKGTPLWNESQATAEKSLELDTERRRQKLTFAEIETIALRATGKLWTNFQNVADYDRTLAELRNPGSQVGKFPGGQTEIQFASRQETLDLGSTPLGVTLPNEIRNLAPRWQDKTLAFDSSLDKALYYAGGTPGALRERIIDDLGQQTGLSAGEIATLARELRQKLAPLARPTASNATVRVPAQMQASARQLTGVDFAQAADRPAVLAWPENFPNVFVMTTVPNLYAQGGYEAAKAGNAKAAADVVLTAARENKFFELARRWPDAILVPVRAEEAAGHNELPAAFATYFGHVTGLSVDTRVKQTNLTAHTGKGADFRMANRPKFTGEIERGRPYIILDDVVTMGGTLGELRAHIDAGGGRVVAVSTLAAAQFSAQLALTPKTKLALETNYENTRLREWLKQHDIYGGEVGALTEAEGRWLLHAKGLDAAGARLDAAKNRNEPRLLSAEIRPGPAAATPPGPTVNFASQASKYVKTNETPPAKVAAARADIERILGVAEDVQLEFVSYTGRSGRILLRTDPSAAGLYGGRPAGVLGAAEALKAPNQPDVVRAAYGIDPADPSNTGSERISSIIPALIADPKRTWDIRGAQITTARDLMTLVTVLRSPYVETAKIILLNRAGVVVHSEIIGIGSLSAAVVDSNQLAGVLNRAPQTDEGYDVILSHNHPSGNPAPSTGDYTVTRMLRGLLSRTKHNLRDHVVTNGDTYYSYAENNWPVPKGRNPRTGQPLRPWYAMGAPSAVTTQPPTAQGADADTRIEPGSAAPWEIVRRNDLYLLSKSANTSALIDSLRQVDPTALHIIYLNIKYFVTALERVPNFKAAAPTPAESQPYAPLTSKLLAGFGREGAAAFMLLAPDTMTAREAKQLMLEMAELSEQSDFIFLDYAAQQLTVGNTARGLRLMEPGPSVDFATGKGSRDFALSPEPAARLADIEQRLAALSNSQENPAEIEARGRALTTERDQLRRELATAEREAQAAQATTDVQHPAAVAIPSEPGDAWAMAPKMTDGELAAERDSITQHIHDQGDGLAPAMRAHLNARLNALSTEQHRRGTPLGTAVTALPQIDRQAALVAELTRGRALAAEGNRTGNDAALNEGNRLVRLAKARLDEEFPGWDATPAPATKAAATQPPLPPKPPTTEAAPANAGDDEQSPFSGSEEETMPVRPGKWSEVYGHSSYTPSFLLKTWRRIAAVLTGIRGPIPELPTFPAARWNKNDPFIAEHGPQFYARIAEGERALKSANDYLQRTAADQIGAIIEPLLKAEGKFSAEDYAQLRRFQEQARRTQAEGKPLPPSLTAGIAALNSKMESSPYVLFNRLIFALDLHWRVQNLKDSAGNAIVLPAGINAAETKAELARLSALLAASPHTALIQTAITAHRTLVAQVAADLTSRELLAADHLANPYYFPHLTLETTQGGKIEQRELTPARVRPGTEADFRGYLETPVGSKKAIEQDYVRAMYYHLVQVGAHNFKADAVRDYFRPYDIKATVERRAKELTKERGVPVTWEQAFNEEFAPRGYVKYGTNSRDAFPTLTINRDLLARRLGVMLTSGDLHAQLKELNQTGVKLLPEDIRESLTQGERETWIVPSRVAEALRGIGDRLSAQDNAVEAAAKWTLQVWKGWKLFMPMSHFRYEFGNVVSDTEKLLSSSPGTLKYLPRAAKELRAFWQGGPPSADLQAALKDGVLNAITAQELDSLVRIKAFEAFETRSQKAWDIVKRRGSSILYQPVLSMFEGGTRTWSAIKGRPQSEVMTQLGLGEFSTPELSAYREAVTRYAYYQGNLEAIRAGARPAYGGAYWRTIEAMTDSRPGANDAAERKAAAISKATFGDYGDLSVLGQTARDKFIPFYSWMEINFRYHANLLRNLRDMVREGDTPAAAQAGKAVALAGLSFTARAAGGLALRLALPYLALALWNNSGDRDELEKLLSEEDRRRTHLILGRDGEGKVLVVYGNTALMDVMKWVSGPKFAQAMGGWLNGKTDFATAAAAWRDAILPDLANNTVGSFGPYVKIPYTLASGKAVFPDVTDQKTIPAYDMRRAIIGQITDDFTADLIERTVNKDYYGSKDLGAWAMQLILQVRQRDPESWAFYSIKDKANDYLEKRTGTKRDTSLDAPDQQVLRNFRRAIYRGDVEKAVQFYQRLLDYGYTAERFQASIRSQDPLSALPKENGLRKQFVDSLSPDDRAQLDRAYVFYQRMNASRGQERQLFPSQSSGVNGLMRYQAQPRTDALRTQMQRVDGMTDEEREQRAQRDERRSLQRTK